METLEEKEITVFELNQLQNKELIFMGVDI